MGMGVVFHALPVSTLEALHTREMCPTQWRQEHEVAASAVSQTKSEGGLTSCSAQWSEHSDGSNRKRLPSRYDVERVALA